jgi:hypothetical protein
MLKLVSIAGLILAATSCVPLSQSTLPVETKREESYMACPERRPEICTRIYQPVCASRDTGIRCVTAPCPSTEQQAYSNACEACSDAKVLGYMPGSCSQ